MIEKDPKRTGVKAFLVPWEEPAFELVDSNWYGPPGAFVTSDPAPSGDYYLLCCPGCGAVGSPREGARWTVAAGSFADVATLTLRPSILKNCCGWHGYLNHGVFELEAR